MKLNFTKLPVFAIPASKEAWWRRNMLVYRDSRKPWTLIKFFLRKFYETGSMPGVLEKWIFVETLEKHLKLLMDPKYFERYSYETFSLEYFIQCYLGLHKEQNVNLIQQVSFLLPSPEATYGYINKLIRDLDNVLQPKRPNQQRIRTHTNFIGVGYKDKGNLRNSSFDGSPSWQEVAMVNQFKPVTVLYLLRQVLEIDWIDYSFNEKVFGKVPQRTESETLEEVSISLSVWNLSE